MNEEQSRDTERETYYDKLGRTPMWRIKVLPDCLLFSKGECEREEIVLSIKREGETVAYLICCTSGKYLFINQAEMCLYKVTPDYITSGFHALRQTRWRTKGYTARRGNSRRTGAKSGRRRKSARRYCTGAQLSPFDIVTSKTFKEWIPRGGLDIQS